MLNGIDALVDEVRLTFHVLTNYARSAHREVDPSGRAVLEFVCTNPPTAVPDIARARGVSRQHIQTIVNTLRDDGLVEALDNAAHRRSPLIVPSRAGATLMERIAGRERMQLQTVMERLDIDHVRDATETVSQMRQGLEFVMTELAS